MAQTEASNEIGPKLSFPTFLLKILASGVGGVTGSLIFLLIFVLASSLISPVLENFQTQDVVSPIFIFILAVMVFLASTTGNLLSILLLGLTERGKYQRLTSSVYQTFVLSIIIFLLMVPVYYITSTINISITAYAIALHIILTAQVSALALEIVSNYRYALVGVYGVTFAILLSSGILFGVARFITNPAILLFAALPIIWGSIGLMTSVTTMIYGGIARIYDKDFLSTQTLYGKDYGKDVEETEEVEQKVKDEAGADFLRKG
ncbi:hypothetical protein GF354_04125 [Candidatus Peregrinibacteria bacterium]|nr:hypothetical protein [Candidatus Peregrinibacteria bacterium]